MVLLGASGVGKSSSAQRYVRAAARRRAIDRFSAHSDNRSGFWHPLTDAGSPREGGRAWRGVSEAGRVGFGKNND